MIERYWLEPLKTLWSDGHKFRTWLRVELAVIDLLHRKKIVSAAEGRRIVRKAAVSSSKNARLEEQLQHDVIGFVTNVEESIGPAGRWIHFGLTSSDVVDTALSLTVQDALREIVRSGRELLADIRPLIRANAKVLIMGRTHGVFAEPMSLGYKFHVYYSELARRLNHLDETRELARVGKLSGAVGMNVFVSPEDESWVLRRLGLEPARDATQILPRDLFAQVSSALALLASSLEHFALEIRMLHQTEICEIQEGFGKGQRGSSAMPHKKNPMLSERICGLARIVRSLSIAQMETVALWHERDLTNSSTERITLPDQTSLVHYMMHLMKKVVKGLRIDGTRIRENLNRAGGVYWSGYILNRLVLKGWSRNAAYDLVQRLALTAAETRRDFLSAIRADPTMRRIFPPVELRDFSESVFWINAVRKKIGRASCRERV